MQLEDVEEEVYAPTAHDEQTEADAAEYLPVTQLPVTADSPTVAQYEPAVHAVHALKPPVDAIVPMEHDEQTVAEATEYLPTAHAPVTTASPVVAQ